MTPRERYGTYGPGRIDGVRVETNLRELGGYMTADGGTVRRGLIFRGPRLADLTPPEAMEGRPSDLILSSYAGMVYDNPGLRTLFSLMLEGGPVYFHCTSGKDRTGIAAILALVALGVSVEDALFDYDLTNAYREEEIRQLLADHAEQLELHPEAASVLVLKSGVDVGMANAAIASLLERYGSFDRYFSEELGLHAAELDRLRELYVC